MSDNNDAAPLAGSTFFSELNRELGDIGRAVSSSWHEFAVGVRNALRRLRGAEIDYVVLPIGGALPERAGPPRSFLQRQLPLPPEPLSLQVVNSRLRAIADADNVRGVLFILNEFTVPGLATLQNVRRAIERLRASGKEAVVFTPYLDLAHYYVACAADRIIVPPSADFEVLGLRVEALFLRDALEQIGVHPDIIQISPYKTAGNLFEKREITPEQRAQLTWLLEDNFDMITAAIANGRSLSQDEVKELVDSAPFPPADALAAGLLDAIAYEDELAALLAENAPVAEDHSAGANDKPAKTDGEDGSGRDEEASTAAVEMTADTPDADLPPADVARLLLWPEARKLLLEKVRRPLGRYVGVVSLEGAIATGSSRQPPVDLPIPFLGGAVAGHETINRLLRRAERQDSMAALILHVDSGGGSALASDLIWRQIDRISRKKPVVVYMGNVAASGGYYVGAAAQHIMSQQGTITGSIGVLLGRFSIEELYQKLHINVATLQRGARADLFGSISPLTDEERQVLWQMIVTTYKRFKEVVAEGREIPLDEIDPLAEGRVWTGRQARARNLVDSHGDFVDAIRTAAHLADLPPEEIERVEVANFYDQSQHHQLPLPFDADLPAQFTSFLGSTLREWNGHPLSLLPIRIRFF